MIVLINNGDAWKMQFDLMYICQHAGKRVKYYDERGRSHSFVPFTLVHARKIFRLIKQNADEGYIINADLFIKQQAEITGDKRVLEQWEKA